MIIQGSPEILQGPRGLNGQFGDVPAGMSDDEYYGKINAYVQKLAGSGLSPEAAQARLLQDMAAVGVSVQDLHYATSMAPSEIKSLMKVDPGLVVKTAQGTAVANDIVYSPAPTQMELKQQAQAVVTQQAALAQQEAAAAAAAVQRQVALSQQAAVIIQREAAAQQAAVAQQAATTPVFDPGKIVCPPGYAFDGETCRPTGLAPAPTTSGSGISPALILATAAAFFFAG